MVKSKQCSSSGRGFGSQHSHWAPDTSGLSRYLCQVHITTHIHVVKTSKRKSFFLKKLILICVNADYQSETAISLIVTCFILSGLVLLFKTRVSLCYLQLSSSAIPTKSLGACFSVQLVVVFLIEWL